MEKSFNFMERTTYSVTGTLKGITGKNDYKTRYGIYLISKKRHEADCVGSPFTWPVGPCETDCGRQYAAYRVLSR